MAEFKREGRAVWTGGRGGKGTVSSTSGTFSDINVTFPSRFGDESGSNPEELIAAAHATCFSMMLTGLLERAGTPPEEIETTATLTLDMSGQAPTITRIHLKSDARVPGIDEAKFRETAEEAKRVCPVSRLLAPGLQEITLDANLASA